MKVRFLPSDIAEIEGIVKRANPPLTPSEVMDLVYRYMCLVAMRDSPTARSRVQFGLFHSICPVWASARQPMKWLHKEKESMSERVSKTGNLPSRKWKPR